MTESGATEREPDPTSERLAHRGGAGEPDVLLDVPEVAVDQIRLAVDGLEANLSLRARLANLLQIDAGVRVHLQGVELDVTGVSAEALLKVRLEKLATILDRALRTIDQNPQVIDALARAAEISSEDVGRAAQQLVGAAGAPVEDQVGQQLGTVGAVSDRTLRERAAEPGPTPPAPTAGPRPPQPPTGPGAEGRQPGRPSGVPEPGQPQGGGRAESPGAAQLAGETLRQAGRSVWDAIQGGMGQGRPKR